MKITFSEQAITEIEKRQSERNRSARSRESAALGQTFYAAALGRHQDGIPAAGGEKGKSLIELQQEAAGADVAVQRDYMTVMSHTMSPEDYAKMQEEGFDPGSMDPEDVVTIVDKIKAELVRSGKNIVGYTDDLDMDTLSAALGSEALARVIVDSFRSADVPLTKEHLAAVSQAWTMNSQLQPVGDGARSYLIDNELEAEIWNLYLAQSSGAGKGSGTPRFYAEDVQGYYTQSAQPAAAGELTDQIDRVIRQSGGTVNEESRNDAAWLLDMGLPLTGENLKKLAVLKDMQVPVTMERFGQAAAAAVAQGKSPVHASLGEVPDNLYEKAAAISEYYHGNQIWEASVGDIVARRQLEEVRLRMTAEVNVKLLRSGFSIDTAPMEELIEALKAAEYQLANQYFPKDSMAMEKYYSYRKASTVADQMPGLPADVLGMFAKGQGGASLETIYNEGRAMQARYEKAQESYEKLMTVPRSDLGDSMEKAFSNVDHILKDLGMETTEENRRAVRILGYNSMEMTASNLEAVKEADRQVQGVLQKLTPAATLKMIRDGFNPLEKSFADLEQYFRTLPPEYKREAESYSRFLYGLEQNKEITPEERESYIGIYRMVRQIEKADGAVVGALVNSQADIHFANLLSAVQTNRVKPLDLKVSENMGPVDRQGDRKESISSQISRAFGKSAAEIRAEAENGRRIRQEAEEKSSVKAGETKENAAASDTGRTAGKRRWQDFDPAAWDARFAGGVRTAGAAGGEETAGGSTRKETRGNAEAAERRDTVAGGSGSLRAEAASAVGTGRSAASDTGTGAAEDSGTVVQSREEMVKTANDLVAKVTSDEKVTREYNKAQLEEQRQAVAGADQECVALLQRGELPASADNLMAAQALTRGRENLFAAGEKRDGAGKTEEKENSGRAGRTRGEKTKEAESTGLWEKLGDMEDFVESYDRVAREAREAVEEATFTEADSSMDVRNLQLNHKQLTVAAALARREEYYLPLYVGDTLTRVHLTLDRSSMEKGTVTVGVTLSEEEHIQARLHLQDGTVHGMLFAEGGVELKKVQEIADTFKREAEGSWRVGNITVIGSEKRMPELIRAGEHTRTDNAELYRVAKTFLQSLKGFAP